MSDLISEGSLGMLEAVKRYDPARGFALASYATLWIRAQIQDYVLRSWSLVRLGTTANQRKLFFNLRRLKAQLTAIGDGEFSPDAVADIAADLAVTAADVVAVTRRREHSGEAGPVTPGAFPDEAIRSRIQIVAL